MKVRSETGDTVAEFCYISRVDDRLVINAKLLGSMCMDMVFTLEDIFDGLKILFSSAVASYALLLPYFVLRRLFSNSVRQITKVTMLRKEKDECVQ